VECVLHNEDGFMSQGDFLRYAIATGVCFFPSMVGAIINW
jgi:hypothetical protein